MHQDIKEYTGERDGDTGGFKQINLLDIIGNRNWAGKWKNYFLDNQRKCLKIV